MLSSAVILAETQQFSPLAVQIASGDLMLSDSPLAGILTTEMPDDAAVPLPHIYAILDPQKALFLEDRLKSTDQPYASLAREKSGPEGSDYSGRRRSEDELAALAPLVIGLGRDDRMLRGYLQTPKDVGPRGLLGLDAGILIESILPLAELVSALRRYMVLEDESGVRIFFRLQEPGMMAAALAAAPAGAVREFVERTGIRRILWTEASLSDGLYLLHSIRPACAAFDAPAQKLVIGPDERAGLTHQVNRRIARDLAREQAIDPAMREDMAAVYNRLLDADYESPFAMESFWILLRQIPATEHAQIWAEVDQHRYSLALINKMLADHYGLQFRVPAGYEDMNE